MHKSLHRKIINNSEVKLINWIEICFEIFVRQNSYSYSIRNYYRYINIANTDLSIQ